VAEGRRVLRGVGVGRRQAVRDGGEAEPREARDGGGAAGADEAAVVVLGVDEGDVEAPAVEDLGKLQHRRDVALRRERQAHRVRLWLLAGGRSSSGAHLRLRLGKGPDEIESLGTEKNYPGTRGRLLQI
jgi:hypothetical protein